MSYPKGMIYSSRLKKILQIIIETDGYVKVEELAKRLKTSSRTIFRELRHIDDELERNQRIIAGNAQFAGIAAGRGVRFTTGLLLLGKGLGMRETPIRPHSWH